MQKPGISKSYPHSFFNNFSLTPLQVNGQAYLVLFVPLNAAMKSGTEYINQLLVNSGKNTANRQTEGEQNSNDHEPAMRPALSWALGC